MKNYNLDLVILDANKERKRKTKEPCPICGFNSELCLCSHIKKIKLQTRLLLIVHAKELKRTTNSGRLAVAALENSQLLVRGLEDQPIEMSRYLNLDYQSVVFFPTEDAEELTPEFVMKIEKPIQLIVPDGNWRQASKVPHRYSELLALPKVMIKEENKAIHHLRKESSSYGMSTLEAIAKALEIVEGPIAGAELMKLYELKLKQTLKGRGIVI